MHVQDMPAVNESLLGFKHCSPNAQTLTCLCVGLSPEKKELGEQELEFKQSLV